MVVALALPGLLVCTRYLVTDDYANLKSPPLKGKPRIALIGFYPYQVVRTRTIKGQGISVSSYSASFFPHKTTASYLKLGKGLAQYPPKTVLPEAQWSRIKYTLLSRIAQGSGGILGQPAPDEYDRLLKAYIKLGFADLRDLFRAHPKRGTLMPLTRDVDYYVLGIHGPPFQDVGSQSSRLTRFPENTLFRYFTTVLSVSTLGLAPCISYGMQSESVFYIMDRNFQVVDEFRYDETYASMTSWAFLFGRNGGISTWGEACGKIEIPIRKTSIVLFDDVVGAPRTVFRSHVQRLRPDLVRVLNRHRGRPHLRR